ncbi:hypothetical protein [Streptomyces sp. NPDC048442]|uniref:hypothetical protein n=1 Tax=Streptomyces sp. NPDC048442 TaxID=3154823 RepID=UPI0034302FC2
MSPDLPRPLRSRPSVHDETGRGLAILDLVADRWGGCAIGDGPYGQGGKTIWFELALAAAPPPLTPPSPPALAASGNRVRQCGAANVAWIRQ